MYGYEREEKQAAQEGVAGFFQRSADNITSQLQAEWLRFGGFIQSDPISLLGGQWRKFNDDLYFTTRLDFGLAYTALWQGATHGTGSRSARCDAIQRAIRGIRVSPVVGAPGVAGLSPRDEDSNTPDTPDGPHRHRPGSLDFGGATGSARDVSDAQESVAQ